MAVDLNRLNTRWQALRNERSGWESAWRDLALHFLPMGWRHDRDSQGGKKPVILNNRLMNSVGVLDMRTLAAGLQGGMTSPVRPWFRLGLAQDSGRSGVGRSGGAGAWLDEVTRRMQMLFHRSNFYNAVHALYADLGTFGTGVLIETADEKGLHFTTLRAGEYCLDVNSRGEVDTLFRRISMTARQIVEEFGEGPAEERGRGDAAGTGRKAGTDGRPDGRPDGRSDGRQDDLRGDPGDGRPEGGPQGRRGAPNGSGAGSGADRGRGGCIPDYIRRAAERSADMRRFDVIHAILPRREGGGRFRKPVASLWWLEGAGGGRPCLLREGGYDSFPAFCPRWDVSGLDVYGRSPAMDVLADCRMLQAQTMTLRKMQHKIADPPLAVDSQLRKSGVDLRPSGLNFINMTGVNPAQAITPIQQPEPAALQYTMQGIEAVEQIIHDGLYVDLFKMLISSDRRQITATEIEAREQEKLILIGPVVERLQKELYAPLIERTFRIMEEWDLLPPLPDGLEGAEMDIEFVSVLAQAQRLVSTSGLDQTMAFALNLAGAFPDALDNINADAALERYAESLGESGAVLRGPEEREAIRKQRAQQQAAAQQQAQAAQAAQNMRGAAAAAKDLGQTVTGPDGQTALDAIIGGLGRL